jgi:hypothetical protein
MQAEALDEALAGAGEEAGRRRRLLAMLRHAWDTRSSNSRSRSSSSSRACAAEAEKGADKEKEKEKEKEKDKEKDKDRIIWTLSFASPLSTFVKDNKGGQKRSERQRTRQKQ